MNTVTIGNRRVVYAGTLILNDNEVLSIDLPLQLPAPASGKENIKLELNFLDREKDPATFTWALVDDVFKVNFVGWRNPTGTAFPYPISLRSSSLLSSTTILLDLAHYIIGSRNIVHLVVMLGGLGDAF